MTLQVLRPNGVSTDAGNYGQNGGPATPDACLVDGTVTGSAGARSTSGHNDATFVRGNATGVIRFAMGTYTLTSSQRCKSALAYIRASSQNASTPAQTGYWGLSDYTDNGVWDSASISTVGAFGEDAQGKPSMHDGSEWTQSAIDAIRLAFKSTLSSSLTCRLTEAYIDLDIRTRPTVAVTAIGTITATHRPTISWTPTLNDGDVQTAFRIKIYNSSASATANPNSASTTGLVYDSGIVRANSTSKKISVDLINDGYKVFVTVAKDFNGVNWWSYRDSSGNATIAWGSATMIVAVRPSIPTGLKVQNGGTVDNNMPPLSCILAAAPTDSQSTAPNSTRAEYYMSTDAGSGSNASVVLGASNPRTVVDANYYATSAGVFVMTPLASALFSGNWYIRCRAVDKFGAASYWSAAVAFTVAHAPQAIPVSPIGGQGSSWDAGGQVFDWDFIEMSEDEYQTAYQVLIETNDTNVVIVDTGKVTSAATDGLVVVPAAYKDYVLRWSVKTWNKEDTPGAFYSSYGLFSSSDLIPLTLTVSSLPGGGATATVDNPQPSVAWVESSTGGRTQKAYRVFVTDTNGILLYDTAWVTDSVARSHQVADPSVLVRNTNYIFWVQFRDSTGLESYNFASFATAWTPPTAPTVTIDASRFEDDGFIELEWDDSVEDGQWVSWRVYRRELGAIPWVLLEENDIPASSYAYHDYEARSGIQYEYSVSQAALRFGTPIESDYLSLGATPVASHYWLIVPDDYSLSVKLDIVIADSFVEEYETIEFNIAGRGRKVEFGDRLGYRGSLTAQLRDSVAISARDKRLALESAKASRSTIMLRTPFGDVFPVSISDVSVTRIPGVGLAELVDITLSYAEVYV